MRKVNYILVGFLLFVALLVLGTRFLIQSEYFAKAVSTQISKNAFDKWGAEIQFSKMEIQMFPPGAAFLDVQLQGKKMILGEEIFGRFEKLTFEFGLLDILTNRLVVKNVRAQRGMLKSQGEWSRALIADLNKGTDKKTETKNLLTHGFDFYFKTIYSSMPIHIERFTFENISLQLAKNSLELDHFAVGLLKNRLDVKGEIKKIRLEDFPFYAQVGEFSKFVLDLTFLRGNLRLNKTELYWNKEILTLKGDLQEREGEIQFKNKIRGFVNGEEFWAKVPSKIRGKDKLAGYFFIDGFLEGGLENPLLTMGLSLKDLKSSWADLDSGFVLAKYDHDRIGVKKVHVEHKGGSADLLDEVALWDIKKSQFIQSEAHFQFKKLHTNSALRVLSPTMDMLQARLTGKLILSWNQKTEDVFFKLEPGTHAEDFHLKDEKGKEDILVNKGFVFNSALFHLDKKYDLRMDVDLHFPGSHVLAKGKIDSVGLEFTASENKIDLKEFGPIVGAKLGGQAVVSMKISGPFEDVLFHFDVASPNLSVVDYNLGQVKGGVDFHLKDTRLVLRDVKGGYGSSEYLGTGEIRFEDKSPLDLSINLKRGYYQDLRFILAPLFKELTFFPEKELNFLTSGNWKLQGDFDVKKLRVEGHFAGKEVQLYQEDFESLDFQFLFENNALSCSQVKLQKGLAYIMGKLSYDLGSDFLEFDANSKKVKLKDFRYYRSLGLGYSAEIQGEFYGSGTLDDFSTKAYLTFSKGYVSNIAVSDSTLSLYGSGSDLFVKGNFLGDLMEFDSYFNFSKKIDGKQSYANAKIHADDAKVFWGLFSPANALDGSLDGNFDATVKSTFTFNGWKDLDVFFELDDFWLSRKDFLLKIHPAFNKIIIKNGNIAVWNLQFIGNENTVTSLGEGDFSSRLRIQNNLNISAGIVEILSEKIQKINGRLKGRSILSGDYATFSHYFELSGDKLLIRLNDLPVPLENVQLGVVGTGGDIFIRDFLGRIGNGDFSLDGSIKLQVPYPLFDLNGQIKNAYIPMLKKSFSVANGKFHMTGAKPPYLIEGNVSLLQTEFLDEFSSLGGGKSSYSAYNRFVPKNVNTPLFDLISYKIEWNIVRPVYLKNSMAEIKVDGRAFLSGGSSRPVIQGEFNLIPNESKFFFKGYEFVISEGKILFNDPLLQNQGEIRIQGNAEVSHYKIKVSVTGKTENPNIALMSEPYLSQEDILSLLTIGVTSDLSRGMKDVERRSMTSVGIGTLLMDQMQLNQGLGNELGLRVSIMPEFSEDESTMMMGRTEGSGGISSRVKSATKIRLQKKITNKMDVSLSSTVGGTMDQKQEMNINYNLSKRATLQGVYEIQATDTGDTATRETSAGADLKFRWTFK